MINNESDRIQVALGYLNQKRYDLAIEEFRKVLEMNPDHEFVRHNLIQILFQQRKYDLAKKEAQRLLETNPLSIAAYQELGNIYFEEGDGFQAIAQFQKVLELYAQEEHSKQKVLIGYIFEAYLNLGRAYLLTKNSNFAIENFKKAMKLNPRDERIYEFLSKAYLEAKDYELAVDILTADHEPFMPIKPREVIYKMKIVRIPNFYGSEVLSTEMNSIIIPPLALGNIVAYIRSQGIPVDQDDLHIKTHYDNYFCEDEEKKIDETVFFDVPRVIGYAKGNADSEIDKIMDKISIKTDFQGYEIILFSLDSCSMNDSHVMFALCLARYLKKRYRPIIILGGLNYFVELMRKNDCNFSDIDYVICNEGEEVVVNLLFSLLHLNNCHAEEGRIEENGRVIWSRKVPKPIRPDFDGLPLDKYKYKGLKIDYCNNKALKNVIQEFNQSGVSLLPFRFVKGCTNRCIFCASSLGGLIHVVNPKTAALWLEELQAKYNPTGYLFLSDTLNISKKYLDQLCSEIIKKKLNIFWSDCVRVDRLDKDSIYKMKDAGCIRMVFGMETSSKKLLDYIKKDIGLKQLEDMLYWADRAGIWTGIEIISGLPYENEKDVKETIAFIKQNREHIDALYYNAFNIKDTSLMRLYPERYGITNIFELSNYEDGFSTFVKYGFDEIDGLKWPEKRRQIVSALNKIVENFGESPFPEHEYESFLFFLYSRYKDKKVIKNLFYSAGKEKMRYLIALRREKKSKWQIKESIDKTLSYGRNK
ncbi:MAG: tetratricopeptide repeat protein [Candidatus Omnitrophica bacterium]|nr:tetratricopeptide repeat protein [Candidatus Omnitrophota bacterium]